MIKFGFTFFGLAILAFFLGGKNTAILSVETALFLTYLFLTFLIFFFIFAFYPLKKARIKKKMKLKEYR